MSDIKLYITPEFPEKERGEGGIRRVVEAQKKYLPDLGFEFVNNPDLADVVNCHAVEMVEHPVRVHSCHGLYWEGWDWANWAYEANRRVIHAMLRADAVISPSAWVSNALARGMLLRADTCPHGVDIAEWEPATPGGYVLWAKNREDPICTPLPMNMLASLAPDIKFISTLGRKEDNTIIIGPKPFEVTKALIQKASVYLATVCETGGITVMESMASGVPILGWNWGVNPELVIHKETGYLAEPDNYQDLLEGLRYCLEHRDRLGSAAREWIVQNRQWKDVMPAQRDVFVRALQMAGQDRPAVSVIITAYNLDEYLEKAIESVIDQEFTDWELIIVDDASPDHCGAIADKYAFNYPNVKVIHNETNQYLAEARNIGIRASRGRYVLALDADDQLPPDALSILSGSLDNEPELDIVTGKMELVEPDGRRWVSPGWPPPQPAFEAQIKQRNQVPYSSMYRRLFWDRVGGYRRRYKTAEDAEFWTRIMSYGAQPARVSDTPTLLYANRPESMSHTVQASSWTAWLTWSRFPDLAPYPVANGKNIRTYDRPEMSVIIPCGPGHERYLQDALDSLIAQTLSEWEVIVVNDTGEQWGREAEQTFLAGYPFVRVLDFDENHGTSWARNRGIEAARASRFVLLDADDFFEPYALEAFYWVMDKRGGFIYCDWYDQNGEPKESRDFDCREMCIKMLGPITGAYPKKAWEEVGGFAEDLDSWEDWDFLLRLIEADYCGTRIAHPLFTYRYHTGQRREAGYRQSNKLVRKIRNRHKDLMDQFSIRA